MVGTKLFMFTTRAWIDIHLLLGCKFVHCCSVANAISRSRWIMNYIYWLRCRGRWTDPVHGFWIIWNWTVLMQPRGKRKRRSLGGGRFEFGGGNFLFYMYCFAWDVVGFSWYMFKETCQLWRKVERFLRIVDSYELKESWRYDIHDILIYMLFFFLFLFSN